MRTFFFLLLVPFFCCAGIDFDFAAQQIINAGIFCDRLGISPGICGCFSHRIDGSRFAVSAPGRHKSELLFNDILFLDLNAIPRSKKSCDEFFFHARLFECSEEIGAILHSHSVHSIALSRILSGTLVIDWANPFFFGTCCPHQSSIEIPIFEHCQDFAHIASEISSCIRKKRNVFGFLVRGHGFFVWGSDMREAKHRLEAFEKLFECELLVRCCKCLSQ